MKRAFSVFAFLLLLFNAFAQDEKEYVIENDGSLSFSKVIRSNDNKTKEELFPLLEAYFAYSYNDGKSVIQTINKEQFYIIGSGVYGSFDEETDSMFGRKMIYSTPHVIRIDCKDGRIRVIITVSKYDIRDSNWMDSNKDVRNYSNAIGELYPIIPAKKENKLSAAEKRWASVFENLKSVINKQFEAIEATINKGNSILENTEW